MKPTTRSFVTFLWRVTYAHVIAYWVAGLFAVTFMGYREHFASDALSMLMLPVEAPMTALGPALQIVRGAILGAVLWLVRDVIFGRGGYWKLGVLVFGLSQVCTIGPTPGSFDGMIYTVLSPFYHLFGLPEAILYVVLLCAILALSYRVRRRYVDIIAAVWLLLIVFFGIMGWLALSGALPMPPMP